MRVKQDSANIDPIVWEDLKLMTNIVYKELDDYVEEGRKASVLVLGKNRLETIEDLRLFVKIMENVLVDATAYNFITSKTSV